MTQTTRWRRLVGATLIATMTPWVTGCYNAVKFAPASATQAQGKKVVTKSRTPVTVNVVLQDGSRNALEGAVQAEGVLVRAGSDSIRLTNATVRMVDRSQSRYREVAWAVSDDLSVADVRLDVARTVLLAAGIAVVIVAFSGVVNLQNSKQGFTFQLRSPD
ncbi:MAG: hypothetical protein U0132_09830 [Gemmatimonadaceae bacterium]